MFSLISLIIQMKSEQKRQKWVKELRLARLVNECKKRFQEY